MVFKGLAGVLFKDGQGDWHGCDGMLVGFLLANVIIIVVCGKGRESVAVELRMSPVCNGCK